MVTRDGATTSALAGQRVLVVNDRAGVAGALRARYPDWDVHVSETYLSAVADLCRYPARAVFAYVDPSQSELADAVAGLRDAAGSRAKLVLICGAEAEPLTRSALDFGADDYLIFPLREEEVEAALAGAGAPAVLSNAALEMPAASIDELTALGEVVSRLDAPADEFLKSLAELLRTAFGATSAGVVVGASAATTGGSVSEPVMTEPLSNGGESIGHVALGPPRGMNPAARGAPSPAGRRVSARGESRGSGGAESDGARDPYDRSKLQHYARLIGHLVTAAGEHRRYQDLAYKDELSGLPNRRYLLEFLDRLLIQAKQDGSTVTVLMFDVDYFKRYNDTYGHDAGDEIIRGCGELFRRNCRKHDLVTRYGGDEFAVVFWDKGGTREPGSRHPSNVLPIIERCRESLQRHQFAGFIMPRGSELTISGGLASFPMDASTVEELITRADEALLQAKREGKNRICLTGENGGAKKRIADRESSSNG